VTLVEQHRFPRDKVCGECLSALGLDVLGRLRLSAAFLKHQPPTLRRSILHPCASGAIEIPLPRPMRGISRRVLDAMLLEAARGAGATVLQPARCERIELDVANPRVVVRCLESNGLRTIPAPHVLVADGKGTLLPDAPAQTTDLGIKAHFEAIDAPDDAIGLYGVDGHYGGVAPIEAGLWNVAFSVPAARVRSHGRDLDGLFRTMMSENRSFWSHMRGARRVSDWFVSRLPRFPVSERWPRGIIPVGNAAAAIEPIGGEGIGLAMRSAELAAEMLIDAMRRDVEPDVDSLRREYRKLWRMRRAACRAAALAVSSPIARRTVAPLVQWLTPVTSFAVRAMGKA
jgi:flavin-dependent dehydrogenase